MLRKIHGKRGLGFPGAREKNKKFSPTCWWALYLRLPALPLARSPPHFGWPSRRRRQARPAHRVTLRRQRNCHLQSLSEWINAVSLAEEAFDYEIMNHYCCVCKILKRFFPAEVNTAGVLFKCSRGDGDRSAPTLAATLASQFPVPFFFFF